MTVGPLIVITDWTLGADTLLERLRSVLSLSPRIAVQHRHPEATGRQFAEEARGLAQLCAEGGNPLFINGRLEVALLVGAHLHLPAHAPRPRDVRKHLPAGRWISAAVHDDREAVEAEGADLVLISPVFPPGSKPDDPRPPLGAEGFARLAARCAAPAYALGGITPDNAAQLPQARGVAVISGVLRAPDARLAAARLLARGGPLLA